LRSVWVFFLCKAHRENYMYENLTLRFTEVSWFF